MRIVASIVIWLVTVGAAGGAVRKHTPHPYRREYKHRTFGRKSLATTAARGALKRGKGGLAGHVGTALGGHVIGNSIEYAVAGVRHEDLHYHPSEKKGFAPRLKHALVSTVATRKTTNGRRTPASGKMSGAVGSGMAVSALQPAGFSAAGGAATGGITLGAQAGANVAREFWPKRHKHKRKRRG